MDLIRSSLPPSPREAPGAPLRANVRRAGCLSLTPLAQEGEQLLQRAEHLTLARAPALDGRTPLPFSLALRPPQAQQIALVASVSSLIDMVSPILSASIHFDRTWIASRSYLERVGAKKVDNLAKTVVYFA